jgi:hypothetical protein
VIEESEYLALEQECENAIERVNAHLATIRALCRQNEMLVQQLQKFVDVFEEQLEGTNYSANQQTLVLNEDLAVSAQLLDFIALENREMMLNGNEKLRETMGDVGGDVGGGSATGNASTETALQNSA